MLVLITDTGRVEQRVVDLGRGRSTTPTLADAARAAQRARSPAGRLADGAAAVADLPEAVRPPDRAGASRAVVVGALETLVEHREERLRARRHGQPHPLRADFPGCAAPVLEALEEQVVLLRLLGEAQRPGRLTVRIGARERGRGLARHLGRVGRLRRTATALGGMGVRRPHPDGLPGHHGRGPGRRPLRRPHPGGARVERGMGRW